MPGGDRPQPPGHGVPHDGATDGLGYDKTHPCYGSQVCTEGQVQHQLAVPGTHTGPNTQLELGWAS